MPLWLGWTLALLVAAGFARLGFWQLARMHEKEAMLDRGKAVLRDRTPMPLADAETPMVWVEGSGTFERPVLLLDNQIREERAGVSVYCILHVGVANDRLVDLGWLPIAADRTMPDVQCPTGKHVVRGLLTLPPSTGLQMGRSVLFLKNSTFLMTRVDVDSIIDATYARIPPVVLRLDPSMKGIGYARDLDVLPNTLPPSRHLGYAVQWFALAAAVLATAGVLTFRKPRA